MPYAQLDDGFYDHPTFASVDDDLVGIWAKGLAYCNKHTTNGAIPKPKALSFCVSAPRETIVNRMVEAQLWRDHGGHVEHIGYLDHNPSREQVRARLKAAKDRKDKWKQNHSGTLPGMPNETGEERHAEHVRERVLERGTNGANPSLPPSTPIPPSINTNNHVGRGADGGVELVFRHWLEVLAPLKFKRTPELTAERRQVIRTRLKEFSADELCRAIDGVKRSPHHCGKNDAGEIYVEFATIFRNRTKVEDHIARADQGPANGRHHVDARDELTSQTQLKIMRDERQGRSRA